MKVKVNYYSLDPRIFIAGTKNSYGFETLEFEFSSEWDTLQKTVTFYPVDGEPLSILLEGDSVAIPPEVMAHSGRASFTVSGYADGKSLVSVNGYLDVLDANDPAADFAENVSEDLISRLMSLATEASEGVKSLRQEINAASSPSVKIYTDEIADLWEETEDDEAGKYPYFCDVYVRGATNDSCVDVYFFPEDAESGIFAPYCSVYNNIVRIYASEDAGYIELAAIKVVTV